MKYLLIAVSIALVAAEGCGKDTYDAFYCFTNKAFCDVPANEKWMSANCAATCCKAAPSGEKVYVRQPGDNALCGNTLKAEGCAESENTRALCPGLCGTTAAWRTPVENTAPVVGKPVVPVVPPLPPKPSVDDVVYPVDDSSCGIDYPVEYCPLSSYVREVCPVMCGGSSAPKPTPKPTPKPAAPTAPAAPTPQPAAPTPKPVAPTAGPKYIPLSEDDSSCGVDYPPEYCELSEYVRNVCPIMCAAPAVASDAPAVASDAPAAAPGSSASADVPAPAAASDAPAGAPGSSAGADVPAPSAASNAPAGAPGASVAAVPAPAGPPSGR